MTSIHSSKSASSEYDFVTKRTFELLGKEDKSARCKTAGFNHMERLHELSDSFLGCTADYIGAIQKFITTPKKPVVEWKYGTSVKKTAALRKKKTKEGLRKEIPGRENETVRCQRMQKEGRNDRTVLAKLRGLESEERDFIEESIKDAYVPQQGGRDAPPPIEPDQEFATPIGNRLFMIPVYSQSSRSVSSPKKKEKPTISESHFTLSASLRSATSREPKKQTQRTFSLVELSPEIDVAPIPKLITTISSHASYLNERTSHCNTSFGYTESAMGFPMISPATFAPMAYELTSHGETSPVYTSGYSTGYTLNGESTLGYTANGQQVYYRPPATGFSVNEVSPYDDDIGFTSSNEGTSTEYTTQGYSASASNIAPLARLRPRFRPQTPST
jgi:hypothetical protein